MSAARSASVRRRRCRLVPVRVGKGDPLEVACVALPRALCGGIDPTGRFGVEVIVGVDVGVHLVVLARRRSSTFWKATPGGVLHAGLAPARPGLRPNRGETARNPPRAEAAVVCSQGRPHAYGRSEPVGMHEWVAVAVEMLWLSVAVSTFVALRLRRRHCFGLPMRDPRSSTAEPRTSLPICLRPGVPSRRGAPARIQ